MDQQHDPRQESLRDPTLDHQSNALSIRPPITPSRQCGSVAETSEAADNFDIVNEDSEQIDGFGEELDDKHAGSESAEDWEAEAPEHEGEGERPGADEAGDAGHQREESRDAPPLGEEEVQPPQVATQPYLPDRSEVDLHCAMGHAQYRSWCEACIAGQGREDRHIRGHAHEKRSLPVVSYDYGFMTEKDEDDVRRGRKPMAAVTRLLIGKDSKSKMKFAHMIPQKGVSHFLMELRAGVRGPHEAPL